MSPLGAFIAGLVAGAIMMPVYWLEKKIDDVVAACTMLRVSGAR